MPTEYSPWQQYQHTVQQAIKQLQHCTDDAEAVPHLFALCQQLTKRRMTLSLTDAALWQQTELCPEIQQTELIWQLGRHYNWPAKIRQLLLMAGYCTALCRHLPQAQQFTKLQRYPALLAARLLQTNSSLQAILSACYPTERNMPLWQQQPLSIVLTVSDYLTQAGSTTQTLLQRIGARIALSKSDYELSILRRLLMLSQQNAATPPNQDVLSQLYASSAFTQLCDATSRQIEQYLAQSDAMMQPILQLASSLNRQQQPITQIRLALNLLGQERLPHLLAHAELHQALLQCHHPLQALFEQVSACLAQALHLLQPEQLTEAASRALALCMAAPLWLHQASWLTALVQRSGQSSQSALDTSTYLHAATAQIITSLLQHYRLANWKNAVTDWLQCLNTGAAAHSRPALTLQLAWHGTVALFGTTGDTLPATLMAQATQQRLLSDNCQDWLSLLANRSQSQYPLLLTL